ncbi:hypothetical protein TYRP_020093 [Tyrophagus putrescentiae]|nr:hypothetical protein TYRP_020093 [Tyrophagus putrescentiae]
MWSAQRSSLGEPLRGKVQSSQAVGQSWLYTANAVLFPWKLLSSHKANHGGVDVNHRAEGVVSSHCLPTGERQLQLARFVAQTCGAQQISAHVENE